MHRLQEVIRLHRLGESSRRIARLLSIGRDTIRKHLEILKQAGLLEGPVDALPPADALAAVVQEKFGAPSVAPQSSSVSSWKDEIVRLRAKGAGPTAIHDHLRLYQPDFCGTLSSIKRLCQRLERADGPQATDVAIPVETAPGEMAQVDFGYAGKRYDADRGVLRKSWVFVMRLGFSRRMYCELVFDQTVQTWIRLHIRAFEYFGGVPRVIVPDNLKAAVVRAAFGVDDDPVIQRTYRELARHYGFQVDPAPPRAPKKKGKVEAGVRFVKGNFLTTWASVDLSRDNVALFHWLAEIADRRKHGMTSRPPIELFDEHEREALLVLPKTRFEQVTWKKARLHTDSHVQIDGAFYSAPWKYLHQELWVRASASGIAIYAQDLHLWTHARAARGRRSTIEEHLPEHRRDLRHRSREHWIERARKMGADVERLIETIFAADDVLTQLRRVQAIVTHLETFPVPRAQATARRALHFGCSDYRGIKNILRRGLDLEPLVDERKRAWSTGSRFARKPTEPLFAHMELIDVHH
jgi:transposase